MPAPLLDIGDDPPGIGLVPAPVKFLGGQTELHDQIAGQVLRLGLAAFLPPQSQQGGFVIAHDDPGVGAADERLPSGVPLSSRQDASTRFDAQQRANPGGSGSLTMGPARLIARLLSLPAHGQAT